MRRIRFAAAALLHQRIMSLLCHAKRFEEWAERLRKYMIRPPLSPGGDIYLVLSVPSPESLSIFTHRAFHGALTSASPVIYHLLG